MMDQFDLTNLDQSSDIQADPNSYNFLKSLDLSSDVTRRISLHLSNLSKGSTEVFLTPIGKSNDPDSTLKDFDKIFNDNIKLMNSALIQIEEANRAKFGPRSIAKPWNERKESLLQYYTNCNNTGKPDFKYTKLNKYRPISISEGINLLKNNTNSGLPYYTRKGKIKDKLIDNFSDLISKEYPCILFTRTQEGGKTRNVWGYPVADTLNEMMYYYPLLQHQKKLIWRSALLGPHPVDVNMTNLLLSAQAQGHNLFSVDFSAYDSTVSSSLQGLSFNYISNLFQSKYSGAIDYIYHRFNTIGIITPDGIMSGKHGVPSGATFTNEVDSLAQYIISKSVNLRDDCLQIQGDDGAYSISDVDLKRLMYNFKRYGLNVNEEKSLISKEYAIYLQKLYHKEYMKDGLIGGIYSVYRALNRIIYQERYSDFETYDLKGIDYYSIRTITILENCKYHPLFPELVKFIYNLDKYSLKFNQKSTINYDRMLSSGSGTGGLLKNQYGDEVRGIMNFKTIKILKELGWNNS